MRDSPSSIAKHLRIVSRRSLGVHLAARTRAYKKRRGSSEESHLVDTTSP
ncbi:MAG: hypothetical protein U0183_12330 [Polyangiaceae bacterium]